LISIAELFQDVQYDESPGRPFHKGGHFFYINYTDLTLFQLFASPRLKNRLTGKAKQEYAYTPVMEKDRDECWASPTHLAPATCLMVGTATEETQPGVLMEAMASHFW
jgi:hypothetical protein